MNKSESMHGYGRRRGIEPGKIYLQVSSLLLYQLSIEITLLQNVDNILNKGTK